MLVIGERINTSRGELLQAVANKDARAIQSEAVRQRDAGADILDVNCGSLPTHEEPEALRWLVKAVQEASSLELCIDSPGYLCTTLARMLPARPSPAISMPPVPREWEVTRSSRPRYQPRRHVAARLRTGWRGRPCSLLLAVVLPVRC